MPGGISVCAVGRGSNDARRIGLEPFLRVGTEGIAHELGTAVALFSGDLRCCIHAIASLFGSVGASLSARNVTAQADQDLIHKRLAEPASRLLVRLKVK